LNNTRIHGLDALRGVLMMLGVVMHAAVFSFPFTDKPSQDLMGLSADVIHIFRMPAFFLIAGFFGALLWKRRGPRAMLKNRGARIALPLAGFAVVLWPIVEFAGSFNRVVKEGAIDPGAQAWGAVSDRLFPPGHLHHLWFLYHLAIISLVVGAAVSVMHRRPIVRLQALGSRTLEIVRTTAQRPWRCVAVFGSLNVLWFALLGWQEVPTSVTWDPDPIVVFYYLLVYSLGWMLFVADVDLDSFKIKAWKLMGFGGVCVLMRGGGYGLLEMHPDAAFFQSWESSLGIVLKILGSGFGAVAFTRGLLGVFLRHAGSGTPFWRYISDSSYWVYLIHLPLTMILPALLSGWEAPMLLRWVITMVLVTGISLVTYDAAVRPGPLGRFLNGRRYPAVSIVGSGFVGVLALGVLGVLMFRDVPQDEWKSPWVDSKSPRELLDPSRLAPLPHEGAQAPGTELRRCIGVERYVVCPDPVTFDRVDGACAALGGSPLIVDDEAERLAIDRWLPKLLGRPSWVALTDTEEESVWRWSDGTLLGDEAAWSDGEPNDWEGQEDCAVQYWDEMKRWNDIPCTSSFAFLCELSTTGSMTVSVE
jgi:glucan biosynthesis protein C